MFTGIIEGIGEIKSIKRRDENASFEIEVDFDLGDANVGDSIAIDGCCLTLTSRLGNHFWADLSDETLRISTLGGLNVGDKINVERALRVGDKMGGHMVQGHVDGVGKVVSFQDVGESKELKIQVPQKLMRYIVDKGSLAIGGISLTVNEIKADVASIRVIPHTIKSTTLNGKKPGDALNLEVDIIGKYVEKLKFPGSQEYREESKITEEFLKKHGF
jgi:riboflavin synthase